MSFQIQILILYLFLINSILSSSCLSKKQLDSRLFFEKSNFNKESKIIFVYNIFLSNEVSDVILKLKSISNIESICVKEEISKENIDEDDNNHENNKENLCFLYKIDNFSIKKYVIQPKFEEIKKKTEEIKSNSFTLFIQNTSNSIKSRTITYVNMSKQNKFIMSMIIFLFSSVFLFVIFRKTVDWGSSAKAELNRYRELRSKILIERIDEKFKYIRPIDL